MLTRKLFTFGTLYPDEMIEALLGEIPENFYGSLDKFSAYKGGWKQLPSTVKESFQEMEVDQASFSYAFAKHDLEASQPIAGRIYSISLDQELILDHWERYPNWYRKLEVTVSDDAGKEYQAFIYTLDIDGQKLDTFERVMNAPEKALTNARKLRQIVKEKFPRVFK